MVVLIFGGELGIVQCFLIWVDELVVKYKVFLVELKVLRVLVLIMEVVLDVFWLVEVGLFLDLSSFRCMLFFFGYMGLVEKVKKGSVCSVDELKSERVGRFL